MLHIIYHRKFDVGISYDIGIGFVLFLTFVTTLFILKAWFVKVHIVAHDNCLN
jgi:hypothetical protein